jgi:hypothetical protein
MLEGLDNTQSPNPHSGTGNTAVGNNSAVYNGNKEESDA